MSDGRTTPDRASEVAGDPVAVTVGANSPGSIPRFPGRATSSRVWTLDRLLDALGSLPATDLDKEVLVQIGASERTIIGVWVGGSYVKVEAQ